MTLEGFIEILEQILNEDFSRFLDENAQNRIIIKAIKHHINLAKKDKK